MLIKLTDIAVIKRQRTIIDPGKLAELAEGIKANGLLHPIVVRRPFEGELTLTSGRPFVLSVGGRRLAAHHLLGREEIEANLKENLDPVSAEIVELTENLQREDISWQDEVAARARIAELMQSAMPTELVENSVGKMVWKAPSLRDIAEETHVSFSQLSKDLSLHRAIQADPDLKTATSKGAALRAASMKQLVKSRVAAAPANVTGEILAKIVTEDARSYIRRIPSQSIDLVFSDLPYGIDYFATRKDASQATAGHYDDSEETTKDFIADIVPECLRVIKPSGWVVFFMCYEWHQWLQELVHDVCTNSFEYIDRESNRCPQCIPGASCASLRPELPPWIWTRRGRGNHGHWPELHASNRYEMIVVVNGGSAKLLKKPVENVLDYPPFEGERLHEMQKPHELCREIIERTTVAGELVLDICYGSGAHLAAAADLGRDFRGCDSNPRNLDSAVSLVSKYYDPKRAEILARAKSERAKEQQDERQLTSVKL